MLYEVAKTHGSLISVQDILPMLPESVSELDLAEAIRSQPSLRTRFSLSSGFLTEKSADPILALRAEGHGRRKASLNLRHARLFLPLLARSRFRMISVSGSSSYASAGHSQDLDFFCVSPAGRMWISLGKALLLSRVYSSLHREAPPICLSCVMDQRFARETFAKDQGPLFARDALQAVVMAGRSTYASLMKTATWVGEVFPAAYDAARGADGEQTENSKAPSSFDVIVNRLLFLVVGSYIKTKSALLNRRLAADGRNKSAFSTRSGEDHLIYESRRYSDLREEYSGSLKRKGRN